jgi:hypothetical protein
VAAVLLCGVLLVSPAAAQTEPTPEPAAQTEPGKLAELFNRLGLFGAWASDCARSASPENPHVNIMSPAEGIVLEVHDIGPGYEVNQYSVLTAKSVVGDKLTVEMLFQPGAPTEQRQTLTFLVHGGTRRTLFNQSAGGAVRVKDGVVVGRGLKTPTLRKCE